MALSSPIWAKALDAIARACIPAKKNQRNRTSTTMKHIPTWRDRLDWTKERSPSSAERSRAMQEEIRDLRIELAKKHKPTHRLEKLLASARQRVIFWRKLASIKKTSSR